MIMFQEELEVLRDRYNEERQSPLVPRNMPPACGRIRWIRQYYRRIELPMEVFKTKDRVIKHRKVQKCIQLFNALAMVFVHYEQLYHEAWCDFAVQVGLSSSFMIRNLPLTLNIFLNFYLDSLMHHVWSVVLRPYLECTLYVAKYLLDDGGFPQYLSDCQ
ncbi:hypothetical protein HHI36_018205 [Cryptolaemus montrouzieri]|uniref:Dynein heavy chain tail domain-containing protein n=1 Tax=Cryptolaemus montrouzieri TaxID=559131 RepID=A0ABD2NZC0_9CUCU